MNNVIYQRPRIINLLQVSSTRNFHSFFFSNSLKIYQQNLRNKNRFGSVLALGANHIEAEELTKYPFSKIVLSGITNPDDKIKEFFKKDSRVSYKKIDMQKIPFKENSFDLVFVKEAIHHIPRPINALYEMLRVSKEAVIFIEPNETFLGNILEKLNLTSQYEQNQEGNKKFRDNFVYRWRKKEIVKILKSYFLESGYKIVFSECWMSNRANSRFKFSIKILNFLGWLASFIPFSRGNYLTCVIFEGKDKPS